MATLPDYTTQSGNTYKGNIDENVANNAPIRGGDLTSANPLVIGTDGNYFDVTGAVTIASHTVAADRHYWTQFDTALQLTHHATNQDLPGEANIITAAGDVAEWQSTGADTVQCVSYTQAGARNYQDRILQRVNLKDYGEVVKAHGNLNSATNANFEDGNVHTFTVTGAFTLTLTNPPASGKAGSMTFEITNGGSSTLTWDPQIIWEGGDAPDLPASGKSTVVVYTTDAGTTINGFVAGRDMS